MVNFCNGSVTFRPSSADYKFEPNLKDWKLVYKIDFPKHTHKFMLNEKLARKAK